MIQVAPKLHPTGQYPATGAQHTPQKDVQQQMCTNARQSARRRVEEQDDHPRPKADGPGPTEQEKANPISD